MNAQNAKKLSKKAMPRILEFPTLKSRTALESRGISLKKRLTHFRQRNMGVVNKTKIKNQSRAHTAKQASGEEHVGSTLTRPKSRKPTTQTKNSFAAYDSFTL